jgi:hypothetical protein
MLLRRLSFWLEVEALQGRVEQELRLKGVQPVSTG